VWCFYLYLIYVIFNIYIFVHVHTPNIHTHAARTIDFNAWAAAALVATCLLRPSHAFGSIATLHAPRRAATHTGTFLQKKDAHEPSSPLNMFLSMLAVGFLHTHAQSHIDVCMYVYLHVCVYMRVYMYI